MKDTVLAVALALFLASTTLAAAQERTSRPAIPQISTEKKEGPKGGGTEEMANAAQQRNDAQQKAWDRKMKALTGTICTGC
jgi:hypothetical protein